MTESVDLVVAIILISATLSSRNLFITDLIIYDFCLVPRPLYFAEVKPFSSFVVRYATEMISVTVKGWEKTIQELGKYDSLFRAVIRASTE